MLKLYRQVTVRYKDKSENTWFDERCQAEVIDGTLHIIDSLADELIIPLDNIKTVFLQPYKEIPREIGE